MAEDWADRYKHPKWQEKRLHIMQRDGFSCRDCRSKEKALTVHHSYYERDRDPWDYPDASLQTVCEDCHAARTGLLADIRKVIGLMHPKRLKRVLAFVCRLMNQGEAKAAALPVVEADAVRAELARTTDHDRALELLRKLQNQG